MEFMAGGDLLTKFKNEGYRFTEAKARYGLTSRGSQLIINSGL